MKTEYVPARKISIKENPSCNLIVRGAFNMFTDFFVQAFKIIVDSWKYSILLLYIL